LPELLPLPARPDKTRLIERLLLKEYPGGPHGICTTQKDTVNADLLAFLTA